MAENPQLYSPLIKTLTKNSFVCCYTVIPLESCVCHGKKHSEYSKICSLKTSEEKAGDIWLHCCFVLDMKKRPFVVSVAVLYSSRRKGK